MRGAAKLAGYSLLQLRRLEEALPLLQRAAAIDPADPGRPGSRSVAPTCSAAITRQRSRCSSHILGTDEDGSLHVQLARAYSGTGDDKKAAALLERSQELHRMSEERSAAAARRTIEPPK